MTNLAIFNLNNCPKFQLNAIIRIKFDRLNFTIKTLSILCKLPLSNILSMIIICIDSNYLKIMNLMNIVDNDHIRLLISHYSIKNLKKVNYFNLPLSLIKQIKSIAKF